MNRIEQPTPQLDLKLAIAERDLGLDAVECSNEVFIETARAGARMICRAKGSVTADDMREWCADRGLQPKNKNAWGAIFRGHEFVPVGFVISKQVSGHGNTIRVWRLRTEAEAHAA